MFYNKQIVRVAVAILCSITLFASSASAARRFDSSSSSEPQPSVSQNPRIQARIQQASRVWIGALVKDLPAGSAVQGVRVESVLPGSPAEKAGIKVGDIIVDIAGKPTSSVRSLIEVVQSLRAGEQYPATIVRDGTTLNLVIQPAFPPAGQPVSGPSLASLEEVSDKPLPRKGLSDINVLKYAFINPATGTVAFVGKYDPTYDTGPIPYADILQVAMENPYPSFSLDPPKESSSALRDMKKILDSEFARMNDVSYGEQWAQRVAELLLDPSLKSDNYRFFKHCAEVLNISGDELRLMYDAAKGRIQMPGTEFMGLAAKMIRGVGLTRAGNALGVLAHGGTPEELLRKMAVELGLSSEFEALLMKGLSPEDLRKEAIILCISEICREFEAPEAKIQSIVSSIRNRGESPDVLIDYMGDQLTNYISNKVGRKMIDGLVLGPEVIARLYNLPVPKAELVFRDLPADSVLGDIFFKSDYRLKSICSLPDAREKVPVHLTHLEFMRKQSPPGMAKKLCRVAVDGGNTLVPAEVAMRVSPDGSVVEFGHSAIKVTGWVKEILGNVDKETSDFVETTTSDYADYLTKHFDEYAKAYPEWHKLSEAAKVIALARWAKAKGYNLKAIGSSGIKVSLPKYVNGFWSAVFEVDEESQYISFTAEGGTSFGKEEGDGWLKVQQDASVTSDALKQLAASAVFAEQALSAAISGDLESARELAEKSAKAMSGEIDLTRLPSLDGVPMPEDPAAYAAATGAVINEAGECLNTISLAGKEIQRAESIAATSPEEAEKIKQEALKAQDTAIAKLRQILDSVSKYKADPSQAGTALVALQSSSAVVAPVGGVGQTSSPGLSGSSQGQPSTASAGGAAASGPEAPSEEWNKKLAKLSAELDEVNKQIAATRDALMKLTAYIQADRKLFEEWEKVASEGFDRSVSMISDVVLDVGISGLVDRYDTIYDLAKKLPGDPKDVIEKYRYLASLTHRMSEAKAVKDLADLAERENKTVAELFETLRDGIGQISGLLGLDKTIPGMVWKYFSLGCDTAYNLWEARELWKNITALEASTERYAQAVQKLAARLKDLVDRQKKIKQQIEAGGSLETIKGFGP